MLNSNLGGISMMNLSLNNTPYTITHTRDVKFVVAGIYHTGYNDFAVIDTVNNYNYPTSQSKRLNLSISGNKITITPNFGADYWVPIFYY